MSSRAPSDAARLDREAGVTIVELLATVVIVGIAVATLFAALDRATTSATFSQRRNEALDDLRYMSAVFGKDVRQGTRAVTATPTQFGFSTYIGGVERDVVWRAISGTDDDRLERSVDGGVANVYIVDLTTTSVFSYFGETNPAEVNRVRLSLATLLDSRFEPVGLATEVEMRNVS